LYPATVYRRPDIEDDQIGIGTMAVKPLHSYERFGVRTRHRGGERGAEQNRRAKASQGVGQAQPE
jgi:hypothetical protein